MSDPAAASETPAVPRALDLAAATGVGQAAPAAPGSLSASMFKQVGQRGFAEQQEEARGRNGGVILGRWTIDYYGRKDPGACVLDEAAGICLTALFVPISPGWRAVWTLATVFAAFRVFDIVKLPPVRQLERLPHGWGILVDDLAAAVYANIVSQLVVRWLIA